MRLMTATLTAMEKVGIAWVGYRNATRPQ